MHVALGALAFGFGWFVTGISWVYYSMYHYGYMPLEWTYVTTCGLFFSPGAFSNRCLCAHRKTSVTTLVLRMALGAARSLYDYWSGCADGLLNWVSRGLIPPMRSSIGPYAGLAPLIGSFGVLLGLELDRRA